MRSLVTLAYKCVSNATSELYVIGQHGVIQLTSLCLHTLDL